MNIPIPTPDLTQATQQLSSSSEGSILVFMFVAIFIAITAYIYFMNKQLKISEEERVKSTKEHENLLRDLNNSLNRLADVQENTMDFIKGTIEHERKNHEHCKDKFFDKLVSIEQYLKVGCKEK